MSVTTPSGRGARVLVVAKAPVAGRTKTRLVPPLTAQQAAALARAMLLDTLETCREEVGDVGVLHAREEERDALRAVVGPAVPLVLQRGEGLGDALASGAASALAERDAVVLVSSDVPGVPAGALGRALACLDEGADVVLGPGLDGGYWLVALRRPLAQPFAGIPWSSESVLEVTLERCAVAGLVVSLLDEWRDVDRPDDLRALASAPDLPGRRTAALLPSLARLVDRKEVLQP